MRGLKIVVLVLFGFCSVAIASESRLPFNTVFKGRDNFDRLVAKAKSENWKALPIGGRTAAVGQSLLGTRYKHFTLEIDNRVEAPSVNFKGMDCWTFFEISLAFARMLDEPDGNWTPETMLRYIETDRYRGGQCTGEYLSRLHYLEDWLADNNRRGLIDDLTQELGGASVPHSAREMTLGWKHYRYLAKNRSLLGPLGEMEARVSSRPLYQIPKSRVAGVESKLRSGDVIGIISRDRRGNYSTAHVGLALRTNDGVLQGRGRRAALELSGPLPERFGDSGGAAAEIISIISLTGVFAVRLSPRERIEVRAVREAITRNRELIVVPNLSRSTCNSCTR
jgi:Protein of unknown function (DUF1460)